MGLAVVLDLLVAFNFDHRAIIQGEAISGVLEVLLFDQHALEGFGIEAEGGAALEALLVGVEVDVLELLVGIVGGHVGGLGNRRVYPFLCRRLDVHVALGCDVIGGDEVLG